MYIYACLLILWVVDTLIGCLIVFICICNGSMLQLIIFTDIISYNNHLTTGGGKELRYILFSIITFLIEIVGSLFASGFI